MEEEEEQGGDEEDGDSEGRGHWSSVEDVLCGRRVYVSAEEVWKINEGEEGVVAVVESEIVSDRGDSEW